MNVHHARNLFIGTKDKVFLDSACVGLVPITARDAILKFLNLVVECPGHDVSEHHMAMDTMKEETLKEASILLNTDVKNLSLIESTTHGLNIAASSISFEEGDEVIICDTEYLQIAIPFAKMQDAGKLCIVPVTAPPTGRLLLSDFERKISKKTKTICLSSVQWCTGQRVFTHELGELCKDRNIWLIVDGVQEAGALNIDVNLRACDFYITGGHKWLNAPYGCGIMYLSERAQKLNPPFYGYLNLLAPEQGWGKFFQTPSQTPFRHYDFPQVAKTFGIGGTGNYPGAIGLSESIKIVNQIGADAVEKRVLELTRFLRYQLAKLGISILSPEEELSGITIFRIFDTHEQDLAALNYFLTNRIYLSIRYTNGHGGFRASTHYFNNEEDILKLCHIVTKIKDNTV